MPCIDGEAKLLSFFCGTREVVENILIFRSPERDSEGSCVEFDSVDTERGEKGDIVIYGFCENGYTGPV